MHRVNGLSTVHSVQVQRYMLRLAAPGRRTLSRIIMAAHHPTRRTQIFQDVFSRHERPQDPVLPPTPEVRARSYASIEAHESRSPSLISSLPAHSDNHTSQRQIPGEIEDRALKRTRPSTSEHEPKRVLQVHQGSPWTRHKRLGTLIQGSSVLSICAPKEPFLDMVMFKETESEPGSTETEVLKKLSHINIIALNHAFRKENKMFLGFEYYRHTLQELLHVHLPMQEVQIKVVARSVCKTPFT